MRGNITASDALKNSNAIGIIHEEVYQIEKAIHNAVYENKRELIVDFTPVSNKDIEEFVNINSFNFSDNTIEITSHGFADDDIIEFKSTDTLPVPLSAGSHYGVIVDGANLIKIYDLSDISKETINMTDTLVGTMSYKKVIKSEQYFKAWKTFFVYPFSKSFIYVLENVEETFRKQGYNIQRLENTNEVTLLWKITW